MKIIQSRPSIKNVVLAAILALVFASAPSMSANDTSYGFQNGTFHFKKNADVSLQKEILNIGLEQVSVDYVFKNESNRPLVNQTVFPMPPMPFSTSDVSRVKNFLVFVDGQPVQPERHFVVLFRGKDVTRDLQRFGWDEPELVKLFRHDYDIDPSGGAPPLHKFPKGLISKEGEPLFTLNEYFTWELRFDPLQVRSVRHSYTPSTQNRISSDLEGFLRGAWYVTSWPMEVESSDQSLEARLRENDPSFLKALEAGNAPDILFGGEYLEYKLKTGANWKGPIQDFTLIIHKPANNSLFTSFGNPQLKAMEVTQSDEKSVTFHTTSFVPREDLKFLFVRRERMKKENPQIPQRPELGAVGG